MVRECMEKKSWVNLPPSQPKKKEVPPAPPISRIETLARSPKYSEPARRSLRKDYEAFKKGGEPAVQHQHRIETQYFESRSPEIARAVDRGDIGRPIAHMLLRHFPHLVEKQIKEIVSACFRERKPEESVEIFRQKRADARLNLSVAGLDSHTVRAIISQCSEMMEAYRILERRGIREASGNWPKRHDGSPRSMMVNRSKLVSLSYEIYKEAHPDVKPEFRKELPIHRYEYRDIEGEMIAIAHIQYQNIGEKEELDFLAKNPNMKIALEQKSFYLSSRKMVSCILEIPRTKKKIDFLQMIKQQDAQIFVYKECIWQGPHFLDTVPKESVL